MFSRLCAPIRLAARHRSISTSLPRRATFPPAIDPAALDALRRSPVFQKLKDAPDALAAIAKFAQVMQANGFETTSGKPPSMLQMSKMFLNPEVRDAAKELGEAFAKAGVDLNNKEMLQDLAELAKLSGGGGAPKS